jgi:uncharacterized membrane protein
LEKTSTGLQENIAGLLCYIGGWVIGIIFLLLEANNKTIRFHAFQSIIIFGSLNLLWTIFWFIPYLEWLYWIIEGLAFILWVVLMVRAYQGKKWKVPNAGDLAQKWAGN